MNCLAFVLVVATAVAGRTISYVVVPTPANNGPLSVYRTTIPPSWRSYAAYAPISIPKTVFVENDYDYSSYPEYAPVSIVRTPSPAVEWTSSSYYEESIPKTVFFVDSDNSPVTRYATASSVSDYHRAYAKPYFTETTAPAEDIEYAQIHPVVCTRVARSAEAPNAPLSQGSHAVLDDDDDEEEEEEELPRPIHTRSIEGRPCDPFAEKDPFSLCHFNGGK